MTEVSKEEVISFIERLHEKRQEHMDILEKVFYMRGGPDSIDGIDGHDRYGFYFSGVRFNSWAEDSDVKGAVKTLIMLFDIDEDEIDIPLHLYK